MLLNQLGQWCKRRNKLNYSGATVPCTQHHNLQAPSSFSAMDKLAARLSG